MNTRKVLSLTIIFILGLAAGLFLATAQGDEWQETPDALLSTFNPFSTLDTQPGPQDRIAERQIEVYGDRVILDIKNAEWARFADTKSMEPVLHAGANAIEFVPQSEDEIEVGDICSYKSDYAEGSIIHRIVIKDQDERGTFFIFKGDNIATSDPGRVRFDQIERCVLAIIY